MMISKNDLFPIGIGTWGVGGFAEKDPYLMNENGAVGWKAGMKLYSSIEAVHEAKYGKTR